MDAEQMRPRVAKAAQFLDKVVPGWFNLINLQTLQMSDCTKCVLGQTFGRETEDQLAAILGDDTPAWGQFKTGFDRGSNYLYGKGRDTYTTGTAFGAEGFLKCMWAEEVAERLAQAEVEDSKGPSCRLENGVVVCD